MALPPPAHRPIAPPRADGKFLEADGHRFLVRGVTYGTFAPDAEGAQFPPAPKVARDFEQLAAAGFNTVRTYTEPPPWLLDLAADHGLRIFAGLAWPQHVPFLDDRALATRIRQDTVAAVRRLRAHPAVLMIGVGNEIPAGIVRWHGTTQVDRFLRQLYDDVKATAPERLFTYVNFPPTEHLDLEYFDVCTFNVYLHRESDLRRYLARLQHIAGARPLLLAEAGADSLRKGSDWQARIVSMQVRAAFTEGACGAVVYAWTDEWWRGGHAITDWAFGLVDEARRPKPALAAVSREMAALPWPVHRRARWPRVSVVVCAYNEAETLDECLTALSALTYPDFEVIVVDDGSSDDTAARARQHSGVRVVEVPNAGLSAARNVGIAQATGEIVAYTDADARVDADWLTYLVQPLIGSRLAGVGGPNVVPPDDPWVAQCVALAPGGPTHVMLDDRIAEHVPGCNMAFRRDALLAIDGFNPVYVRAGDDVDICWRLQARGLRIGFAPSALVWHHRRASVQAYWRQQVGYGEGETWLDAHHPEKFLGGHMLWRGRIYSPLPFLKAGAGRRVNTGVWGTAAFPSVYNGQAHRWHFLPHAPGWIAGSLGLGLVGLFGRLASGAGAWWLPIGLGGLGVGLTVGRCVLFAWRSDLDHAPALARTSAWRRLLARLLIAWLHLIQPLARIRGRWRGLASPQPIEPRHATRQPWRVASPSPWEAVTAVTLFTRSGREWSYWSEAYVPPPSLLSELVGALRASRPAHQVEVDEGWRADRDFSVAVGRWGWLHVRTLVEEHQGGRCLLRVRARLRPSLAGALRGAIGAAALVGGTAATFTLSQPSVGAAVAGAIILAATGHAAWRATRAMAVLDRAVARAATAAGMRRLPLRPLEARQTRPSVETAR